MVYKKHILPFGCTTLSTSQIFLHFKSRNFIPLILHIPHKHGRKTILKFHNLKHNLNILVYFYHTYASFKPFFFFFF